jgi:hypothetical protein
MLIFTCCLLLEVWLKFAGQTFQPRVLTFPFPPKSSEKVYLLVEAAWILDLKWTGSNDEIELKILTKMNSFRFYWFWFEDASLVSYCHEHILGGS